MPAQNKSGPKSRLKEWEQPEKLTCIVGWKRNGLTDVQVAKNMGISPRTLYKWRSESVQIMQALKRGKEAANFIIENVLYNKALKGDNTAMIFWLKNNWREKYSDSKKTEDENKLIKEQRRKASAEADIMEAKAKREAIGDTSNITINIKPIQQDGGDDSAD